MILLDCTKLWKYPQTSSAGRFPEEGPLQLRPGIKTDKAIQDAHSHFYSVHKQNFNFHFLGYLPANSPPSLCDASISSWSCSTMEPLQALLSVGHLHPRVVSPQQRVGSPCLLHSLGLCSLLGRVTHCFWHALRCGGLCSTLSSTGNPAKTQQCHPNPPKLSQFAARRDLICLLLSGFTCLAEVCAFCRQRGGGGRGWQGRWRTRWYTEYIEQRIMYWVMQQPEN